MIMQLASLGSGSKGNATLVKFDSTVLLIDCGFSLKQFHQRLDRLKLSPESIDAILVTHEHSDHCSGVARLARNHQIPVWTTRGTARSVFDRKFSYHIIRGGESLTIGKIEVLPVTVPHDACEPVQFIFTASNGKKLGILTDTGHITSHIISTYNQLDGLLLEFNYDQAMLEDGPYPYSLKQRVSGDLGHLSNMQSLSLLKSIDTKRLSRLIAGHISENNNSHDIVANQLQQLGTISNPVIADQ
ncbi:MAG: MBL fold metallo-hydrolase, partial [Gammaproteobacteria bacterium]|nr:MBL fold metallo-hydrolase [Gammaproteobacteria bacterium]